MPTKEELLKMNRKQQEGVADSLGVKHNAKMKEGELVDAIMLAAGAVPPQTEESGRSISIGAGEREAFRKILDIALSGFPDKDVAGLAKRLKGEV